LLFLCRCCYLAFVSRISLPAFASIVRHLWCPIHNGVIHVRLNN
jgi:hypothetical protein